MLAQAIRTLRSRYGSTSTTNAAFALAVLLLILIASLASEVFLTDRNLTSISRQIVTNGLLSLGMLLVILTGGIDLSVGSVLAFAGLLATGLQAHMPFPLAILVALAELVEVGLPLLKEGVHPFERLFRAPDFRQELHAVLPRGIEQVGLEVERLLGRPQRLR